MIKFLALNSGRYPGLNDMKWPPRNVSAPSSVKHANFTTWTIKNGVCINKITVIQKCNFDIFFEKLPNLHKPVN